MLDTRTALGVLAGVMMMTVGCGGGAREQPPATTAGAPVTTVPATAAPPAGAAVTATNTTTSSVASLGIPECDEYLNKYMACVETKVPAETRTMMKQQLDATRDAWQKAATTPEAKAGLATSCTQALASVKQAMASYNCTW
jgi:hypothetical protein